MAQRPPMPEPIAQRTVGIIGHVRHGKTRLVRALTGIDTDRLPEEKARGMTIVLGFAHCQAGDALLDLIDVPGHEAFVATMVAGATGLDAAVLVVDAREGVMPQTREHVAIARLLGVRIGLVALCKADLVVPAERVGREDAIRAELASMRGAAPLHWVSAATGEGIETLRAALGAAARTIERPDERQACRLAVDRVFTMHGRGIVTTGTLREGHVAAGMQLEVLPSGQRVTVREVQIHGRPVEAGRAGQRVGLNLRGVEADALRRGDMLAAPGLLGTTRRVDARLELLEEARHPLADRGRVQVLFATTSVAARIRTLGAEALAPGASGFVQLQLERPIAALPGDRFIVRIGSPPVTIGGGTFVDCAAARHRRADDRVVERLARLQRAWPERIRAGLSGAGREGIEARALARTLGLDADRVLDCARTLPDVLVDGSMLYAHAAIADAAGQLARALARFHREQPTRRGAPLAWCRQTLGASADSPMFRQVLAQAQATRELVVDGNLAWRTGHDPWQAVAVDVRTLAVAAEAAFRRLGLNPPDPATFAAAGARGRQAVALLLETGRLVPLHVPTSEAPLLLHRDALIGARDALRQAFPAPARFTLSQARIVLGSTRKYVVPLMEHFDACRVTRRYGDERCLLEATDSKEPVC